MYRKLIPMCLAMLLITNALPSSVYPSQTQNITITGRIIDGKSVGIDSVLIYSAIDSNLSAQTNSDGFFELHLSDTFIPIDPGSNIPSTFNISAPYPNPANSGNRLIFNLNKPLAELQQTVSGVSAKH